MLTALLVTNPGGEQAPTSETVWNAPDYFSVILQSADADAAPIGVIEMSVSVTESDPAAGFCSTFATVGTAVASAVNGAAAGVGTLLGLACSEAGG